MTSSLMAGKKGLILGIANDKSIAYGIARQVRAHGGELALTYQGDALKKRVTPIAEELGCNLVLPADVTDDAQMSDVFAALEKEWGGLDFIVHGAAYADKDQLKGKYLDTTLENFTKSLQISCFSFTDMCRRARPLMKNGGACLTLSYLGAERYTPHYNVMGVAKAALEASVRYLAMDLGEDGIRVNAVSAGPIKTLAASGIGDFRYILKWNEYNSALQRNVTIDDVGGAGLYLLSDLARGVTGEIHHVDNGYHAQGMINTATAHLSAELMQGFRK